MPTADPHTPHDFLVRASLDEIDPFVADLIRWEEERQARKLILIPSESSAPGAVRQALGSAFQNVYAEGYPPLRMTREPEEHLQDVAWQLANYRRYGDRRFYKGVDYVHFVECLAQRRCAELFAHGTLRPEHIFVNVQPLSGAAANLAVYAALMKPGDTLMGLDLFQGGHLTHGSRFNLSGQRYKIVSYGVDPRTERLDYEAIGALAREHHPRVIVAGFTSYPWAPDWDAFRTIADEVGAFLMADIAHSAGMAAAGVYPNPVGIADVTTFTTHKTICGPRGAVILTTDEALAGAIDRSIFPGAQGGPHVNKFAAMAVAFGIARGEAFQRLQRQIVTNARSLADALQARGLRLACGGTNTHLLLVDLKSLGPQGGSARSGPLLWGEPAVHILDLAGIVANKNTIPGDTETALATGIRLGTPWVTQRGLDASDMDTLAGLIHRLLSQIRPFAYRGLGGTMPRGKIPLEVLDEVRAGVAQLADKAGIDFEYRASGYPHYMGPPAHVARLRITGYRAQQFVQQATTGNLARLALGASAPAAILDGDGRVVDRVLVTREAPDSWGRDRFLVAPTAAHTSEVTAWLRALSDGFVLFDPDDVLAKVDGPVVVDEVEPDAAQAVPEPQSEGESWHIHARELLAAEPERFDLSKPYFVGGRSLMPDAAAVPVAQPVPQPWRWEELAPGELLRTVLYATHRALGARMVPFAGWEMPVWYTSVGEEHRAVREAGGLFDVAHMGLLEATGPHATAFLDTVCTNSVAWLEDGQSCYGYLLDPAGAVIDDIMVYRLQAERYLVVVNASNSSKDWNWLTSVNEGRVIIDRERPWVRVEAKASLLDLKDAAAGDRQRCDLALQGPASLAALQGLAHSAALHGALSRQRRTEVLECELAGVPAVVARTGYTGEEWGYEIFAHPDHLPRLWEALLEAGAPHGVRPAGLAARDSTRTEAGLPLYGHELAGEHAIGPLEAGFAGYVKFHKPFFVGRAALLAKEAERTAAGGAAREIVRFRVDERGVRRPQPGDSVANKKGQLVGYVTSCSIDAAGSLVGLALVDARFSAMGNGLAIFPLGGQPVELALGSAEAQSGSRVPLPVSATVLARFMGRSRSGRQGEE